MDDIEKEIVEQELRQIIKQIQYDYHCSFSEAIAIAKKWIHEFKAQEGADHER